MTFSLITIAWDYNKKSILALMIIQFYLRKMNTKNSSVLAVTIAAIMLVGGMIAVISVADADAQRRARGGDGGSGGTGGNNQGNANGGSSGRGGDDGRGGEASGGASGKGGDAGKITYRVDGGKWRYYSNS